MEESDSQKSTESILRTASSGLTMTHSVSLLDGEEQYQKHFDGSSMVFCSARFSYDSEK